MKASGRMSLDQLVFDKNERERGENPALLSCRTDFSIHFDTKLLTTALNVDEKFETYGNDQKK